MWTKLNTLTPGITSNHHHHHHTHETYHDPLVCWGKNTNPLCTDEKDILTAHLSEIWNATPAYVTQDGLLDVVVVSARGWQISMWLCTHTHKHTQTPTYQHYTVGMYTTNSPFHLPPTSHPMTLGRHHCCKAARSRQWVPPLSYECEHYKPWF